jgi:transcription-repair coupling factor (superfamily II helicase)
MQVNAGGLPNTAAKAFFALSRFPGGAVFCARGEEEVSSFLESAQALAQIIGKAPPAIIHFGEERLSRSVATGELAKTNGPVFIGASFDSLHMPAEDPAAFAGETKTISRRYNVRRAELCAWLEKAGYERAEFVERHGEYAVRGAVMDIFPPALQKPARIFLAADQVESIRVFDIETQNTGLFLDALELPPCRKATGETPLYKILEGKYPFILDSTAPAAEGAAEPPRPENAVEIRPLPPDGSGEDFGAQRNIPFNSDINLVLRETQRLRGLGMRVIISCLNRGELERVEELFGRQNAGPEFTVAKLREGFYSRAANIAIITSGDIFSRKYTGGALLKKFDSTNAKRIRFKDLKAGDFVVHETYGIARYLGLRALEPDGSPAAGNSPDAVDCLLLEYKNGHKLFVPLADFAKVQKFVGAEGTAPRLAALGGKAWNEVKARVKKGVEEAAKEILKMEAERAASQAPVLGGETHMEREFADSFPYEETPDQTKAINSILADLELPKPMDRVLAGDVGFGKTEVAMRGALRCALSGGQVAVVVPTTVLAAQHYRTFKERFAGFPITIAMLCRFQTAAEQKKIIADMRSGACDIVVGTHRLLSKDISFKRLSLCIVDEEHRFGVRQKEKIKRLIKGAHTLMMSATPIPRTLYQAMSSLREISVIETPPSGRMPISTRVTPWDDKIAAAALREELARGGQVYYVHNRVRTLASRMEYLQKLVPEARFVCAHGQMDGETLEQAMWDFFNRKYDVLLASTIIESGLDMPEVNTLIVEDAQNFGLSQLYQLRGRIGRGDKKAFCYLFYPQWLEQIKKDGSVPAVRADIPGDFEMEEGPRRGRRKKNKPLKTRAEMTEEACKRLSALMEFCDLGSGFRLAMRDLEIRGAGELLGLRQHGFINEVGLSLYCELLNSEVRKLRGNAAPQTVLASFDAPVQAHIPPDYLPDDNERLNWYRRLLGADGTNADTLLAQLEDLCGPAPQSVRNITEIMKLRHRAAKAGVRHMEFNDGTMDIYFRKDSPPPPDVIARLMARYSGEISFMQSQLGDGVRIAPRQPSAQKADALKCAAEAVSFLKS